MAKFTIFFNDHIVGSEIFESGIVHIGRDESNQLVIDSLSVAPAHAVVLFKDENWVIKQLNDHFPLRINKQLSKERVLQDNDVLNLGKHAIVFNTVWTTNTPSTVVDVKDVPEGAEILPESIKAPEANLQVINGEYIGRVLPLKKALTRLGREGSGVVVVAHRKEGYYLSALQEHDSLMINNQPLGDRIVKLNPDDVIVVDNVPMQFFVD
jgi:hypothetical protein